MAILWDSVQGKDPKWGPAQVAAQALTLKLQSVEVREPGDFERAFAVMIREHADGLLAFNDGFTSNNRRRIVELASKNRLPAMYEQKGYVDEGGLMSYGPHVPTCTGAPPPMWTRS